MTEAGKQNDNVQTKKTEKVTWKRRDSQSDRGAIV